MIPMITTDKNSPVRQVEAERLLLRAYDLQEEIKGLEAVLADRQEILAHYIDEAQEAGITTAGNYELMNTPRVERKVNIERFTAQYPEVYDQIKAAEIRRATRNAGKVVRLADAERLLDKDELAPVCDLIVRDRYLVVKRQIE